jgi:hypothetical protein
MDTLQTTYKVHDHCVCVGSVDPQAFNVPQSAVQSAFVQRKKVLQISPSEHPAVQRNPPFI